MKLALLLASVGMLSAQYYPPGGGGGSGGSVAASSVTAGTFGAGNYVFPGNVTVGTSALKASGDMSLNSGGLQYFATTASPTAPVLAVVGTPDAITYGYKLVFRTPTGTSSASAEATIATGNPVLDGSNYVTVSAPACVSSPNTTVDVWLTTTDAGSDVPTTGFIANIACGATYNHQGQDGDGLTPPSADTTTGEYLSGKFLFTGHGAIGPTASINMSDPIAQIGGPTILAMADTFTSDGMGFLSSMLFDPVTNNHTAYASVSSVGVPFGNTANGLALVGPTAYIRNQGSGSSAIQGPSAYVSSIGGSHVLGTAWGNYVNFYNEAGTVDGFAGYAFQPTTNSAGTITSLYGFYSYAPNVGGGGASVGTLYSFYADDQANLGITNNYYSWYDSRGVLRTKEDSTFDSVGQAITALYNPQFTKYTPGAVNYERCIPGGQWHGNVCEIGTEKGGTGTLRGLKLIGATLAVPVTTGAASGKHVLCVDNATKVIYESSTGTDCSN